MKLVDYLILAAVIGCMYMGYSGHRVVAVLLLTLTLIVASWRFWDKRQADELTKIRRGSGELNPALDRTSGSSHEASAGDAGGDD